MKLVRPNVTGVQSAGRVPDHSGEIRQAYSELGAGFNQLSDQLNNIERDRLDDQQQAVAHEYEILKLNHEAEHYNKTEYSADDLVLQGLDVKLTESVVEDGIVVEKPRSHIPADEVWPELMQRYQKDLMQAQMLKIESPRRREKFEQVAHEKLEEDNLRMVTKTTEAQYARASAERDTQINQLRIIGTPEARAQISEIINGVTDSEEKATRQEWWAVTKVTDTNTVTITDAMETKNAKPLEEGYMEYLGYASGKKPYKGPLNKEELEAEAHRFYTHWQRVESWNDGDDKLLLGYHLANVRRTTSLLENGYHVDNSELTALSFENERLFGIKESDTLVAAKERIYDAVRANGLARNELSSMRGDQTINEVVESVKTDIRGSASVDDKYAMQGAIKIIEKFEQEVNSDPMATLNEYQLADNPDFPITPINWADADTLSQQLAQREMSFNYYKGMYGFNGHILTDDEKAQFGAMLEDDRLTTDHKLGFMLATSSSLESGHTKFWGPFLTDTELGQYAGVGQLLVDHERMGTGSRGWDIGRKILDGYAIRKGDPTIIEDYAYIREQARKAFGTSYNGLPGVRDSYINMAEAYGIATLSKSLLTKKDALRALDIVTGGMIESGSGRFLTPDIKVNQRLFDEFTDEVHQDHFPSTVAGWAPEQIAEGVRSGSLTYLPTGHSRNSFYLLDRSGAALVDKATKRKLVTTYDPNAKKRRP
jgi:hypothetical protein